MKKTTLTINEQPKRIENRYEVSINEFKVCWYGDDIQYFQVYETNTENCGSDMDYKLIWTNPEHRKEVMKNLKTLGEERRNERIKNMDNSVDFVTHKLKYNENGKIYGELAK